MLKVRDLEKRYFVAAREVAALRGVSLDVAPGQFVVILGRSGSGKSTLLTLLGGLARPTAGTSELDGAETGRLSASERARRIGYMFQFSGLLPTLTALDNALLPARLAGRRAEPQAIEWLTQLGLGDRLWALPEELSGGEQRRVAAVRALINQPRLVLADEPTGDLDPASERQVLEFLRRHSRTLVLVTHNAELARGADQLFRMHEGLLERLQAEPEQPAVAAPPELTAPSSSTRPWARPPRRWVGALVLLLALVLAGDLYSSWRERSLVRQRAAARKALERAAMHHFRADVESLERAPGGTYLVRLLLDNSFDDQPLYGLAPEVTAYVQVGFGWVQVPLEGASPGELLKLVGRRTLEYRLKPAVPGFEEVLPGYMHVRFTAVMRLSLSAQPGPDEVLRRSDNYFIYLQPEGADPVELARRNHFPRQAPLWIPMPPH